MGNFEAATNGDLNIKHKGFHHTVIIKAYQSGVDVFCTCRFYKLGGVAKNETMWICQSNFSWQSGGVETPVGSLVVWDY